MGGLAGLVSWSQPGNFCWESTSGSARLDEASESQSVREWKLNCGPLKPAQTGIPKLAQAPRPSSAPKRPLIVAALALALSRLCRRLFIGGRHANSAGSCAPLHASGVTLKCALACPCWLVGVLQGERNARCAAQGQ